jgi:spore maturation protein CgeB
MLLSPALLTNWIALITPMLDKSLGCGPSEILPSLGDRRLDVAKLAIVGGFGGTHIGGSLARAALQLGVSVRTFDTAEAMRGNRGLRSLKWHFAGHRPLHLSRFSKGVVAGCADYRPEVLISTGAAALTRESICALRAMNVICINYSTDDPWNPNQRSTWYLRALSAYHVVFTARRANIDDFHTLGCRDVRYLPFAYDEQLFAPIENLCEVPSHDVLFVGGADRDRIAFISAFMKNGPPVTLVGSYWDREASLHLHALGNRPAEEVRALTGAAKVNLCLVRWANRDDNVMRSFEIGAIGGCTIAEDTAGHRNIFGADGEAVRYFRGPTKAAELASALLADPSERNRLAAAIRKRITGGSHTYRDRLITMLSGATRETREEHTSWLP